MFTDDPDYDVVHRHESAPESAVAGFTEALAERVLADNAFTPGSHADFVRLMPHGVRVAVFLVKGVDPTNAQNELDAVARQARSLGWHRVAQAFAEHGAESRVTVSAFEWGGPDVPLSDREAEFLTAVRVATGRAIQFSIA